MHIRPAGAIDADGIWRVLEPMIRAGETYPLPQDMRRDDALAHWFQPAHEVFVAVDPLAETAESIVGTFYLRANSTAGAGHVANCGYVTAPRATGRGVARAMCLFSFERARERGFRAMQFNLVVATNQAAVHLWQSCGMEIVGRLPKAFRHPTNGYVDAIVMYRLLVDD
jgi:RimJ/RimL family protein N-acetyltransferase